MMMYSTIITHHTNAQFMKRKKDTSNLLDLRLSTRVMTLTDDALTTLTHTAHTDTQRTPNGSFWGDVSRGRLAMTIGPGMGSKLGANCVQH